MAGDISIIKIEKNNVALKSLFLSQLTKLANFPSVLAAEIYFITTKFIEPGIIPKSPINDISAASSP